MPFHDLNVVYTNNHADLSNTLAFLKELEYTCIAFSIIINGKLPAQLPSIPLDSIKRPPGLNLLSRLTLTIADTSQNHRINALTSAFDLVALRPTNEKAFQLCCGQLECDLISLDFAQRIPFPIKFKTVASALQRGIRFEICYSAGITGGNDARRNLIGGAAALIRATRARGIVLCSEARSALGLRGPWDVVNLAQVWGLSQERGREAVVEEAGRVVELAGLKRTSFRGVVDIIEDGTKIVEVPPSSHGSLREKPETQKIASEKQQAIPPALQRVTVIPDKSTKRKLSTTEEPVPTKGPDGKPLSKREQKRQAKKVRLDRALSHQPHTQGKSVATNAFAISHETLMLEKKEKKKKG